MPKYKAVSKRAKKTVDEFEMGETREIIQKNGVRTTVTKAVRNDGFAQRDITIFANGQRADRIQDAIKEGMISRLLGIYSQRSVFVALDRDLTHA